MSRFEDAVLVAPDEVAIGPAAHVGDMTDLHYSVGGTFTCQFDLQGSVDKIAWYNIQANLNGAVSPPVGISDHVRWLRLNMTAYTSGYPIVRITGLNQRAD